MLKNSDENLANVEKISSTVRNIIFAISVICPIILYFINPWKGEVTVKLHEMDLHESGWVFADQKMISYFLKLVQDPKGNNGAKIDSLIGRIGQLDEVDYFIISNRSDHETPLQISISARGKGFLKKEYSTSSFLLVKVESSWPVPNKDLIIGDNGYLVPDSVYTFNINEFKSPCELYIIAAKSNISKLIISVMADHKILPLKRPYHIFGNPGWWADRIIYEIPWKLLFILSPIAAGFIMWKIFLEIASENHKSDPNKQSKINIVKTKKDR